LPVPPCPARLDSRGRHFLYQCVTHGAYYNGSCAVENTSFAFAVLLESMERTKITRVVNLCWTNFPLHDTIAHQFGWLACSHRPVSTLDILSDPAARLRPLGTDQACA